MIPSTLSAANRADRACALQSLAAWINDARRYVDQSTARQELAAAVGAPASPLGELPPAPVERDDGAATGLHYLLGEASDTVASLADG
jgi:hypothetical protein